MNIILLFVLLFFIVFIFLLYLFQMNKDNKQKLEEPIGPKYISDPNYNVQIFEGLLSDSECKELIQIAKNNKMEPSQVVSDKSTSAYDSDWRNSSQIWMDAKTNPILTKLSKFSEELTGYPYVNQEMVQIVKYEIGGKFDAHFDSCVHQDSICKEMNRKAGERRTTMLVYLNDDMEGGETEFVEIDKKIKPQTGKAIMFQSTNDKDQTIKESKHRGCPVVKGEKWIATIWSHSLPY
jgi:prolyl 4-hydroxylase